jgi:uncharacterized protein (TIGR02145 family)
VRNKNRISIFHLILIGFVLIFSHSCRKEDPTTLSKQLPVLSAISLGDILQTTATVGATITSDGRATVTARGVCWSTATNLTTADSKTSEGAGTGAFTSNITGLTANTVYYVRAYATTGNGTGYGSIILFRTLREGEGLGGTITDSDGNVYKTVTIGTQVWMAENLKTTRYRNGDLIGTTTPTNKDISGESTPKYQWAYGGIESNADTYGRLYTWYAATDSRNVCPTGFHIPTDGEWTTLTTSLGGENAAGGKLKETGTTHWADPNTGATNVSRFTALPGNTRGLSGESGPDGIYGSWWSSTEYDWPYTAAWNRLMSSNNKYVYRGRLDKGLGISVRCIRDL